MVFHLKFYRPPRTSFYPRASPSAHSLFQMLPLVPRTLLILGIMSLLIITCQLSCPPASRSLIPDFSQNISQAAPILHLSHTPSSIAPLQPFHPEQKSMSFWESNTQAPIFYYLSQREVPHSSIKFSYSHHLSTALKWTQYSSWPEMTLLVYRTLSQKLTSRSSSTSHVNSPPATNYQTLFWCITLHQPTVPRSTALPIPSQTSNHCLYSSQGGSFPQQQGDNTYWQLP